MYRIIGVDGQQYGPIIADDLRRWIAEGRANAQTLVHVEGAAEWKPLGTLPEFAAYFTTQQSQSRPPTLTPISSSHVRQTNSFALWGMIIGILALLCCCLKIILGIVALIFSIIGLMQINEQPDRYEGRGFAIAGIVLGALALLLGLGLLFFGLAGGGFNTPYHHYMLPRRF